MGKRLKAICVTFVACGACVFGQFVIPGALAESPIGITPFSADVTVTITTNGPFGQFSQTQTGKLFRNDSGKTRQDTSRGSVISDAQASSIIYLNHLTKEATLINVTIPETSGVPTGSSGQLPAKLPGVVDLGQKVISGLNATGQRILENGNPGVLEVGEVTTEIWTSIDLHVPISLTRTSSRGVTTQILESINLANPDPSVFAIPAGYVIKQVQSSVGRQASGVKPQVSGVK